MGPSSSGKADEAKTPLSHVDMRVSRAVYIEVLDNLSTHSFINGSRLFIAIRGSIKQLRTDKGQNLVVPALKSQKNSTQWRMAK